VTNSSVHEINTKCKNQLHIPSVRLPATLSITTYSSIKIFNKLQPRISGLKNCKVGLKSALRKYLLAHDFYSIDELLVND